MLFHARNILIPVDGTVMPCAAFGRGGKALIMLPGLGDGLKDVRGTALMMAWLYRMFCRDYTVYMLSRRDVLPPDFSVRDMAEDVISAMDWLGVGRADVFGVSMGGMIAQHMAVGHPDRVGKLVLAVTCARTSDETRSAIGTWIDMAQRGDHRALMNDNLRRIYTDAYCRKNGWAVSLLAPLTKPRSYAKFLTMARACMAHDARAGLSRIASPVLVIGGRQDRVVGPDAARELAAAVPGALLHEYPHLGHGAYDEAPDFNRTVLQFLKGET